MKCVLVQTTGISARRMFTALARFVRQYLRMHRNLLDQCWINHGSSWARATPPPDGGLHKNRPFLMGDLDECQKRVMQ